MIGERIGGRGRDMSATRTREPNVLGQDKAGRIGTHGSKTLTISTDTDPLDWAVRWQPGCTPVFLGRGVVTSCYDGYARSRISRLGKGDGWTGQTADS